MISACQERHERVVELYVDIAVGETSHVGESLLCLNVSLPTVSVSDNEEEYAIGGDSSSDTDLEDGFDSMMIVPNTERNNIMLGQSANSITLFWNISSHYTAINWEHPDQELDFSELYSSQSWVQGDALYVGQLFDSKEEVKMAIKHYAMKKHQTFFVVESKASTHFVKCVNHISRCPWKVRALLPKNSNKWKITRWGGMVKEEPSVPVSLIQERISGQFGYSVSYKKAWKAKQKAIVTIFGDWDESYATLPRWLEYMQLHAPGSVYKIETNDYVRGNVDGTFLYGKYKQTLLIATTQDGNNSVLSIAFAIVEGETLSAWEWFLAMIRLNVTDKTGICLISDRHQSIKSAVSNPHIGWQPPNAYHVYCIRHIASNFNRRFKNSAMKSMLMKLAYTPCKQRFEAGLNKFRSHSPEVQTWIDNISKEKWSLAYDHEGRRYGHMTTNLSESVNKVLKEARNLPITTLVKATYSRLVEYFVKRGESAINDMNNGKRNVAYRYPCSHVIAACVTVSIDFWQYVDPVYTLQYVVNAYSSQWWLLGNEANILQNDEWKLLPD
ncbi:uncharacterized protein LOC113870158 [Abrus precatorius]|uniref:Uncharacterized protein LOC113870158 n=1 Tax=Abrus precatorius TaxID=3816 RepID=A0A8B8M1M0_ABRPR|nr:uncharacterized protein LOC113870158 [Abrus precatorius]